jgi:hypothetical protein
MVLLLLTLRVRSWHDDSGFLSHVSCFAFSAGGCFAGPFCLPIGGGLACPVWLFPGRGCLTYPLESWEGGSAGVGLGRRVVL